MESGAGCVGDGQWTSSFDATAHLSFFSLYGWRDASITGYEYLQLGIDLASGTVLSVSMADAGAKGLNVKITHADGVQTEYLHMGRVLVKAGDQVTGGQPIGEVGNTDRSIGPICT